MAKEVETKVLDVDSDDISKKLSSLGAKKILQTKLKVSWFNVKNKKEFNWYLRIRTYSDGKNEVTWKGKSTHHGVSRSHKEINLTVSDFESMAALFQEIGLEMYAFQEKYRSSWSFKKWRFDLDQYPKMPAYLEIEGEDEKSIQEAIELLELKNHEIWNDGEKTLIEDKYKLKWTDMKF